MNIENKKQFATIALAVMLGVLAAFLAGEHIQSSIQGQTKQLATEYEKRNSVVIQELDVLKRELKKMATEQQQLKQQQRQVAQQSVSTTASRVEESTVQLGTFSVRTPPGKRALTVMIDSLSAVGGLVTPGDAVDIIAHLEFPKPRAQSKEDMHKITTMLLQNIQVLAVGTNFQSVGNEPAYDLQQSARSLNVTLALSPEEAGLLSFAQKNGQLQLTLRSPSEQDTQILQVASWDTLSDYLLERQGTELNLPRSRTPIETVGTTEVDEVRPFIQIFKQGQESNL